MPNRTNQGSSVEARIAAIRNAAQSDLDLNERSEPYQTQGSQDFKNKNPWDKWDDYPRWDKRGR